MKKHANKKEGKDHVLEQDRKQSVLDAASSSPRGREGLDILPHK